METIEYQRRMRRAAIAQTMGYEGDSYRFTQVAPSPNFEVQMLSKPSAVNFSSALQDPVTGLRYFIPDMDVPGDPNHPIR